MATRKPRALRALAFIPVALVLIAATDAQPIRTGTVATGPGPQRPLIGPPREHRLQGATPFEGDLRSLPQTPPRKFERPERAQPKPNPIFLPGTSAATSPLIALPSLASRSAPAPFPIRTFDGLDFSQWGSGWPPDTNGDVGPNHYIQTINTSIGIYDKSTGTRLAAFTFDTLMSQGKFGNLCDTDNFGDPIVLYDEIADRWIVSDFAFKVDAVGNVVNPPGAFQCFAVSRSGNPVTGGWNFYSLNTAGGLGDYPKFGIWPDGLYMSVNMFDFAASGPFQNPRAYAFNTADMYAGAPTPRVVSFDAPAVDFTLLPASARLQTGTPPPGTPNYYVSTWQWLNALSVYKFHVDWDRLTLSTFTGPDNPISATSLPFNPPSNAPSLGGNNLDVLPIRAMMQNRYTNFGGAESLWVTHTVRRQDNNGFAAPRWYQAVVTGGTVSPTIPQAATWDPEGANFMHRFVGSLAVDRAGNMALGYSTSSSTTKPAIKYAGRLATDPLNIFSQAEQVLFQGAGTQAGNCGSGVCDRWGDYSAMTLDPDGCTFWYTGEYYNTDGLNYFTRVGSFLLPNCTPSTTTGFLQGTVTSPTGPIAKATLALETHTTTTDGNGRYSFSGLPPGTYPLLSATASGFNSSSTTSVVIGENTTTTKDFSLAPAPASNCLTDTTLADFLLGSFTNTDVTGSTGDVTLLSPTPVDQQNTTLGNFGVGINTTTWGGQTFTPTLSGQATKVDVNLFCSGCTGTSPSLSLSIRATSGGLPTGPDLATATIPGFNSGSSAYYTANFTTPATLTAGTQYAYVIRPNALPTPPGVYALTRSGTSTAGADVYPGGTRVTGASSGTVWTIPTTPPTGGTTTDTGFRVYIKGGTFAPSGTFVSGFKDANPPVGDTPTWNSISWNASVPVGTSVLFQAAGSNSVYGPFTFVGPDGTPATSFTTGASLAQFNGSRYIKYRATLSTSDTGITPAVNDATVCFGAPPVLSTTLAADAATGTYGGTVNLSATLSSTGTPLAGGTIAFSLNGSSAGTAVTGGNGVATLSSVPLAGINAGTYPTGVTATFGGDAAHGISSGSNTLTVGKASQTISFGALADKVATDPAFTVSATGGGSNNPVTFSTPSTACNVTGNTVSLLAAGNCTINADQAGTNNYNSAPTVTQTFKVSLGSQTITFPQVAPFVWKDGSATLSAASTSNLAVTYSVLSGPCQVSGTTLTATGAGTCLVAADQAGNTRYAPALQVTQSITVDKAAQAISFGSLSDRVFTDPPFTVTATGGGSGNAVTFSSPSVACSVSVTGTVTLSGAGTCVILADQVGNSDYVAAPTVTQTFNVLKATQSITFGPLADKIATDAPFTVTATGGASGNPVTFSTASTACGVTGNTVTLNAAGSCAIQASQAGSANYQPASPVTRNFAVLFADQTIDFPPIGRFVWKTGSAPLNATATSGLAVTYNVTLGRCIVTGNTATAPGAGSCVIAANQSGNARYAAATTVTAAVQVDPAPQAIAFGALPDKLATDAAFAISATGGDSGNPIVFSTGSPSCSVTGNTVTPLAAGSCTINADQQGNADYTAAPRVTQTFQISLASQSITFPVVASFSWSGGSAALGATSSSGLSVTYSVVSGPCLVAGNTLTATHAGSCTISANQSGNLSYAAAATATTVVVVLKSPQSITFPPIDSFTTETGFTLLRATSSSGLKVTYSVISGPCQLTTTEAAADALISSTPGTCVVAADQSGNEDYFPAQRVTSEAVANARVRQSGGGCQSTQTSSGALEMVLTIIAGLGLRHRRRKTRRLA